MHGTSVGWHANKPSLNLDLDQHVQIMYTLFYIYLLLAENLQNCNVDVYTYISIKERDCFLYIKEKQKPADKQLCFYYVLFRKQLKPHLLLF